MKLKIRLLYITVLLSVLAYGQSDSLSRKVSRNEFAKINYENDYFTGTDMYYTQGIKLELVFPAFRYSPVMFLLPALSNSIVQYEINFDQNCFTPTSITVDSIQRGDRPYAGYIYLGHVKTSTNEAKEQKLTAEADIGAIGACAECGEEQTAIHRGLHDNLPDGWKYQIGTKMTFNYRMQYEKGIVKDTAIDIFGYGGFNAGNVYDNAIVGGRLRLGKVQSYFAGNRTSKLQLYTFLDGWIEGMAYNATMQGVLFSNNSIYALPSNALDHIVMGYSCGIDLSYKSIALEYYFMLITHEILDGQYHGWGHISIATYF